MDRVRIGMSPEVRPDLWEASWFVLAWHMQGEDTTVWLWGGAARYCMIDAAYLVRLN